jgi:alanyl-tRNA synthetase
MDSATLRQSFLDFFASREHRVVPGSSLVPGNDPTLLFTNSGMVQFKDVFLGHEKRKYTRAASVQRCLRAGGKHNDLENVGYTARHHTFFEMLGNFSFGDYFKQDAIELAWEYLTGELGVPEKRLWVTVFEDDDEAADIWLKKIGVSKKRFGRLGAKDNFWAMGDTGPCGPCSEIFYDHGRKVPGGPPGSPDEHGDRYVEIWNLVFMQFDRAGDGELAELPKPSVDTGMGLERMAAVMQGVTSNYDIDLFRRLIAAAAEVTGADDLESSSLRVIADHIRACAFLIADGVLPGNEGRGYVLRRIIRRALRHGYDFGVSEPFFFRLVQPLQQEMGAAYPILIENSDHVEKVLHTEEERFDETLNQGMRILEDALDSLSGKELSGDVVFKLYDTYGFPADLTADVARNRGIAIDQAGFDAAMLAQRERGRAAHKFGAAGLSLPVDTTTDFVGYDQLACSARIVAILKDGDSAQEIIADETGQIVLDHTPFYAESGGQVGDQGHISTADSRFRVDDTQKHGNAHLHIGVCETGRFAVGDEVEAGVNAIDRARTVLNHSATHLLHAALRQVLGKHVMQKGSLVAPDRLRFDFSHYEAVTAGELARIERLVNEQVRQNRAAETKLMAYDDAIKHGAVALFDEKYGDEVRVLKIGDFSVELCGGTHVSRAGDIGLFKITSESGIAAGVRRIEAVTGDGALDWINASQAALDRVAALIKGSRDDVGDKVLQVVDRNRALEKELKTLRGKLAGAAGADLAAAARDVKGVKVLSVRLDDDTDPGTLRDTVDRMKDRLGTAVVVLGSATADGKVRLAAGVTADATDRIRAGDLIKEVAVQVGGKGGGRADFAQAGGTDPQQLDAALASAEAWVSERLD